MNIFVPINFECVYKKAAAHFRELCAHTSVNKSKKRKKI